MATTAHGRKLRKVDAKNRSVRTFLQGLGIDVAVSLALLITTLLATNNDWGSIEWAIVSYSFVKTLLQTVAAYVMRQFLDPSGFPTPLPPEDPGPPEEGPVTALGEAGATSPDLFLYVGIAAVVVGFLLVALTVYHVAGLLLVIGGAVLFLVGLAQRRRPRNPL